MIFNPIRHAGILFIAIIAVIILPVVTVFYMYPSITNLLREEAKVEAVRIATLLISMIPPEQNVIKTDSLPVDYLNKIQGMQKNFNLMKIKIFSRSGEIIYSTDPEDIGNINKNEYFHEIVAKGDAYAIIVQKGAESLETQTVTTDVVETYVPIIKNNRFIGAFEIYYDITTKKQGLDKLKSRSSVMIFTIAFTLLVLVVISLLKANRAIFENVRTKETLKENQERYRSLVDSTDDSIYLVDRDYRYLFMNKKHISRMGLSEDQYLRRAYSEFHSPEDSKEFTEQVDKVFENSESVKHEHRSARDQKHFLRTLSPVKDLYGRTVAVTVVSKDITERKRMEEELRELSLTDELTGLYNRRGLFTLAGHLLRMADRVKRGFYMLYADFDNLKGINDTFGHREGDLVLMETANILKDTFRDSDIIARIGGDEFVVVPVGTTEDCVEIITARLQKALDIHNEKTNHSYNLSLSFGITYYDPESPCSIGNLLVEADKLMYEQKRRKQTS
jgi:diguanylate cyclase (GGDEF)-like protein/PAS domain S-box-containing protein